MISLKRAHRHPPKRQPTENKRCVCRVCAECARATSVGVRSRSGSRHPTPRDCGEHRDHRPEAECGERVPDDCLDLSHTHARAFRLDLIIKRNAKSIRDTHLFTSRHDTTSMGGGSRDPHVVGDRVHERPVDLRDCGSGGARSPTKCENHAPHGPCGGRSQLPVAHLCALPPAHAPCNLALACLCAASAAAVHSCTSRGWLAL